MKAKARGEYMAIPRFQMNSLRLIQPADECFGNWWRSRKQQRRLWGQRVGCQHVKLTETCAEPQHQIAYHAIVGSQLRRARPMRVEILFDDIQTGRGNL
jgi:hypothetical protein